MLSLFRHGLEWPWVVHVQIASHNLVMGRRLPATERTPVENGHYPVRRARLAGCLVLAFVPLFIVQSLTQILGAHEPS